MSSKKKETKIDRLVEKTKTYIGIIRLLHDLSKKRESFQKNLDIILANINSMYDDVKTKDKYHDAWVSLEKTNTEIHKIIASNTDVYANENADKLGVTDVNMMEILLKYDDVKWDRIINIFNLFVQKNKNTHILKNVKDKKSLDKIYKNLVPHIQTKHKELLQFRKYLEQMQLSYTEKIAEMDMLPTYRFEKTHFVRGVSPMASLLKPEHTLDYKDPYTAHDTYYADQVTHFSGIMNNIQHLENIPDNIKTYIQSKQQHTGGGFSADDFSNYNSLTQIIYMHSSEMQKINILLGQVHELSRQCIRKQLKHMLHIIWINNIQKSESPYFYTYIDTFIAEYYLNIIRVMLLDKRISCSLYNNITLRNVNNFFTQLLEYLRNNQNLTLNMSLCVRDLDIHSACVTFNYFKDTMDIYYKKNMAREHNAIALILGKSRTFTWDDNNIIKCNDNTDPAQAYFSKIIQLADTDQYYSVAPSCLNFDMDIANNMDNKLIIIYGFDLEQREKCALDILKYMGSAEYVTDINISATEYYGTDIKYELDDGDDGDDNFDTRSTVSGTVGSTAAVGSTSADPNVGNMDDFDNDQADDGDDQTGDGDGQAGGGNDADNQFVASELDPIHHLTPNGMKFTKKDGTLRKFNEQITQLIKNIHETRLKPIKQKDTATLPESAPPQMAPPVRKQGNNNKSRSSVSAPPKRAPGPSRASTVNPPKPGADKLKPVNENHMTQAAATISDDTLNGKTARSSLAYNVTLTINNGADKKDVKVMLVDMPCYEDINKQYNASQGRFSIQPHMILMDSLHNTKKIGKQFSHMFESLCTLSVGAKKHGLFIKYGRKYLYDEIRSRTESVNNPTQNTPHTTRKIYESDIKAIKHFCSENLSTYIYAKVNLKEYLIGHHSNTNKIISPDNQYFKTYLSIINDEKEKDKEKDKFIGIHLNTALGLGNSLNGLTSKLGSQGAGSQNLINEMLLAYIEANMLVYNTFHANKSAQEILADGTAKFRTAIGISQYEASYMNKGERINKIMNNNTSYESKYILYLLNNQDNNINKQKEIYKFADTYSNIEPSSRIDKNHLRIWKQDESGNTP